MDNYQNTIDRFDSSELNRTWYFERFSPILEDNNEEELNQTDQETTDIINLDNTDSNLVTNVYTQFNKLFKLKKNLNYDELNRWTNWTNRSNRSENINNNLFLQNSTNNLLSNSSINSFVNNSSFDTNLAKLNSTNYANQIISPQILNDNFEDDFYSNQIDLKYLSTNLSSIHNLINDQIFFSFNSTNQTDQSNQSTIYNLNSTTFTIQTIFDDNQTTNLSFNNSKINDLQPQYNWIYILVVFLIIFGVLGNCLVCLAIIIEKRLQNATNYFLLSLAIADLLVSVIVMPFLMLFDFYGYWPFSISLCNFWVTCDVLLCTSSIIHLLFISVTRYIGIRHPLTARRVPLLASRKAALLKILIAWFLAALISSPITILGIIDEINIQPQKGICAINNRYFFTLGSIVSFFLPMLIMVNTYVLTIRLLKRKAKLCQKENDKHQQQQQCNRPKPSACKVLVQDNNTKRHNSISSMSSDYSTTGLGTTTIKDLDYVTQNKTNENLSNNAVQKDQSTHTNHHKPTTVLKSHKLPLFWNCRRKDSNKDLNHLNEKTTETTTNGNLYIDDVENERKLEKDQNNKTTKIKMDKNSKDSEGESKFQGIRVLFSKNKKQKKKLSKKSKRNKNEQKNIQLQLDEQHNQDDKNYDNKNSDDQINGSKKSLNNYNQTEINESNLKKVNSKNVINEQQIEQHKMRKSNTFTNLELKNEINNNQNDHYDRKKKIDKNIKMNSPSLALLSPSTISQQISQTRRLSAHSEIHESTNGNSTIPVTPTSSTTNPFNSMQPVLVRTLGSNQVLTEQKATKVLGVVFFVFLFCWAPFFINNFLSGVWPDLVNNLPSSIVSFLQWLGYVSSTLNPIIYTVFNVHFRRTFKRILLCKTIRSSRHKLKSSPHQTTNAGGRLVSFRGGSSISRGQNSSFSRKKLPPNSIASTTESLNCRADRNYKPSSFTSTRNQSKKNHTNYKHSNELNLLRNENKLKEKIQINTVDKEKKCPNNVLNKLEKPGQN